MPVLTLIEPPVDEVLVDPVVTKVIVLPSTVSVLPAAVRAVPRPSVDVVPPESFVAAVTVVAVFESAMAVPAVAVALV